MNPIQKATLGVIGGLNLSVKRVGNQVSLVESYRDALPVLKPYNLLTALEKEMKRNPFLYSALRKKADAIASVPFYVEQWVGNEWVRVPNHEAEYLIEGANPFMSGFELKKLLVYHKELVGSAYMQIVSVDGRPAFLQPLFPQFMRVVPSEADFLTGFEYGINGFDKKMLSPSEVFWTKHTDPSDPYKGLSPLESINGEMQTDLEARRWNKISLANRGASDVAFIMRDVVTEEDYSLARMMIEDRIAGPDNARRPWIVGGNSDVRPMSYTAVEMDYINTRKFNREVIAAALGVPAPLIGDADNSTYNNLDILKRDFWQDTISTWLEEIRQDLTRQILIPFYGDGRRTRRPALRYMYDLSNVEALQANLVEKAEIALTMRKAGFSLRDVNQFLEFGFEITEEPPSVSSPQPSGSVDMATVTSMAELALAVKHDSDLFEDAVRSIQEHVASALGVEPELSGLIERVGSYLEDSSSAGKIAEMEMKSCRR